MNDTWDDANPSRPKTLGFMGSEEFIRLQFEDYIVALLSAVKYHNFMIKHANNPRMLLPHIDGDPATDFNIDWVEAWMKTENYRIWNSKTDDHLFDIAEPRHICAGGLTIDDVSRRVTQQVQDLHLDEKLAQGKVAAARNWAAAREKGGTMINKFYSELEAYRETQRKKAEENKSLIDSQPASPTVKNGNGQSYGEKAGSYMSSWASWAGEKRKALAARSSGASNTSGGGGAGASGWGINLGRGKSKKEGGSAESSLRSSSEKDTKSPRISTSSSIAPYGTEKDKSLDEAPRPVTQHSFSESILGPEEDGAASSPETSPVKPKLDFLTKENGVWNDEDTSPVSSHKLP